jgi:hypothetical protein
MIRGGFDSQLTADLSTLDREVLEALVAAQQEDILSKNEALSAEQEKQLSRENEIELRFGDNTTTILMKSISC